MQRMSFKNSQVGELTIDRTTIEWVRNPPDNITQGGTNNFVVGCSQTGCSVGEKCYAKNISKRFNGGCEKCKIFTPHFHKERLKQISDNKKPKGYFLSMGELFDHKFTYKEIQDTLDFLGQQKQHRFYLLTKQSLRLTMLYFPSNIWLGVTINRVSEIKRVMDLKVTDAKIKFISFEPLYEAIPEIDLSEIDWIIIGGETKRGKTSFVPEKVWVHNLIGDARKGGCAVFLKNNLGWKEKIEEFPKE